MFTLTFKQQIEIEQIRSLEEICGERSMEGMSIESPQQSFLNWLWGRARVFKRSANINQALLYAPQVFHWLLVGLMLVLAFLGASACYQAMINGPSDTLNIFWILGVLLGVNLLSLFLWLILLFTNLPPKKGFVAVIAGQCMNYLLPKNIVSERYVASKVWLSYFFGPSVAYWRFGQITHLAWLCYLSGGALFLVFILSTREFNFIWSSTLLGGDTFVSITQALALPLQLLHIPSPSVEQVLESQHLSSASDLVIARKTWAYFLLGCILVYGHLPRFVLFLLCWLFQKRAEARAQLDLTKPYYIHLKYKVWARNESHIIDADHCEREKYPAIPKLKFHSFPESARWLGIELEAAWIWPHSIQKQNILGVADDIYSASKLIEKTELSSQQILVLIVKAEKAADRGIKRLLTELVLSMKMRTVWIALAVNSSDIAMVKIQMWATVAVEAGISSEHICLIEAPQC